MQIYCRPSSEGIQTHIYHLLTKTPLNRERGPCSTVWGKLPVLLSKLPHIVFLKRAFLLNCRGKRCNFGRSNCAGRIHCAELCILKVVTKNSAIDIGLESPVTVKHQDDVYANIIKLSHGKGFLIGTGNN